MKTNKFLPVVLIVLLFTTIAFAAHKKKSPVKAATQDSDACPNDMDHSNGRLIHPPFFNMKNDRVFEGPSERYCQSDRNDHVLVELAKNGCRDVNENPNGDKLVTTHFRLASFRNGSECNFPKCFDAIINAVEYSDPENPKPSTKKITYHLQYLRPVVEGNKATLTKEWMDLEFENGRYSIVNRDGSKDEVDIHNSMRTELAKSDQYLNNVLANNCKLADALKDIKYVKEFPSSTPTNANGKGDK